MALRVPVRPPKTPQKAGHSKVGRGICPKRPGPPACSRAVLVLPVGSLGPSRASGKRLWEAGSSSGGRGRKGWGGGG